MNNLAHMYRAQGNYTAAEPLYVECLEKARTILGIDHPNTLTSMCNLGSLYGFQGSSTAR